MNSEQLATEITKALVKNPKEVSIERKDDERGTLYTAKVNKADMGALIGKEGLTVKAIRTILRAAGMKDNPPCVVAFKVAEPEL